MKLVHKTILTDYLFFFNECKYNYLEISKNTINIHIYIWPLLDITHSIRMFYRIPKKIEKGKKKTTLHWFIASVTRDITWEDLLKSDMDYHERIWIGKWLKVVAIELSSNVVLVVCSFTLSLRLKLLPLCMQ